MRLNFMVEAEEVDRSISSLTGKVVVTNNWNALVMALSFVPFCMTSAMSPLGTHQ